MGPAQLLEPRQVDAGVVQQRLTGAARPRVRPGPRGHVVVPLDVAHAVAVDQPVEGLREIVPRARGAEVEEVASVLNNARFGPVHERVLGEGPCERGPHADHLGLDPEAGREAAAADEPRNRRSSYANN